MRIAQIATLGTRVRETGSGSIESLVWQLSRELTRMGNDVTVFAARGSDGPFEVIPTLAGPYGDAGAPDDWHLCEWIHLCSAVAQSRRFDVIHSHNYLWGIPLQGLASAPMIHTTHIMPDDDEARLVTMYPGTNVTGISRYQWSRYPEHEPLAVIHHGIDHSQFTFSETSGDYLCFLGRFTWGKGPHVAIETARELGMPLLLAGPANEMYRTHIEQHVDGTAIKYIGPIGGADRNRLLAGARALLYPLLDPEPFGLVMPEAMLCGTPVAAISVGAVPELVDDGVTGCLAPNRETFSGAVLEAMSLDRRLVRQRAAERFTVERMTREYLDAYNAVVPHD